MAAETDSKPFSCKASRTEAKSLGSVVTVITPSSVAMSSAPASRAASMIASSLTTSASYSITPFRLNI